MPADHRRAAVAAQLDALCGTGEVLDVDGPRSTRNLYADEPTRRHTRTRIIARYRDEQQHIACDRQFFAIATAGPPGAGKSTTIEAKGLAVRGWRVLDADRVKDHLIGDAVDSGVYADLLEMVLADGHRLMPRELATLVHRESTAILDEITEQCLDLGENVVIEGTFGWPGLGDRLLRQLGAADYRTLTIIDVEVPLVRAQEQALRRWWGGRQAAIAGTDPWGGRFTSAATIAALYPDQSGRSVCAVNARAAFDNSRTALIPSVELMVDDYTSGALIERVWTRHDGVLDYQPDPVEP